MCNFCSLGPTQTHCRHQPKWFSPVQRISRISPGRPLSLSSSHSLFKSYTMSLASPALLSKSAAPLRILAASRPANCQRYPDRTATCQNTRTLYTFSGEKRHPSRTSNGVHGNLSQARVSAFSLYTHHSHHHYYHHIFYSCPSHESLHTLQSPHMLIALDTALSRYRHLSRTQGPICRPRRIQDCLGWRNQKSLLWSR